MHFTMFVRALIISIISLFPLSSSSQPTPNWPPRVAAVYLQHISPLLPTVDTVTDISANQEAAFALMKDVLYQIKGKNLTPVSNAPAGSQKLFQEENTIMAAARDGFFEYKNGRWNKKDNHDIDRKSVV